MQVFKQTPEDSNKYIEDKDFEASLAAQQNMKLDTLTRIKDALLDSRPSSYADCIAWARWGLIVLLHLQELFFFFT